MKSIGLFFLIAILLLFVFGIIIKDKNQRSWFDIVAFLAIVFLLYKILD